MTRLFHPLLFLLARATADDLQKQNEFLKAENEILRKHVPKKRIFLKADERSRLLKLGKELGPAIRHVITIVSYSTFRRWVRKEEGSQAKPGKGRPRLAAIIRKLVVQIANDTGWGYTRILGEVKKLHVGRVSRQSVKNILVEHGLDPGPKRGKGSWSEFLKTHVDSLWQVDFFSKMIWTPTGLRQAFVLAFLHVGTRRVICSPCSFSPGEKWLVAQAHACLEQAREAGLAMTHVIHDRDGMYVAAFDQDFKDANCRVIRTAPQAPNQNAFIER